MMHNPLVSIIIPIYKTEKYLRECIDSVLSQIYKNLEIILVDDGSPDNCPQICDEYAKKDDRVKVVHKENGGLPSARLAGAEVATGSYITCVDGDDYIASDCCGKFVEIIEKYNADIVICGFYNAYPQKLVIKPICERAGLYDKNRIEKEIYPYLIEGRSGNYFSPTICGKAFRRDLYIESQKVVDLRAKVGEDQCVTRPCIVKANSLYIMEDCLYYYRQNPESMTKAKKPFDLEYPKINGMHFEEQMPLSEYNFREQVYRHVVHDLFNACVSQFNGVDGYKKAKKRIKTALNDEYYKTAIKKAEFRLFSKGYFAQKTLKHKNYFIMYLFNKCKIR